MAEIRWDYEQISSFVDQLESCIDVLKDQHINTCILNSPW